MRDLQEPERGQKYKELARQLFDHMPEVRAAEETDYVIFYGELVDDKTKFVVTRVTDGQISFRLLHPNLARLERSTVKIIKRILNTQIGDGKLSVSNNLVVVYERGFEDIIIEGQVISKPFQEAMRNDRRDMLLVIGTFLILVPVLIGLFFLPSSEHRIAGGTLERLSTALITTIIVSGLGFFQAYYEIRREKFIKWIPYSD